MRRRHRVLRVWAACLALALILAGFDRAAMAVDSGDHQAPVLMIGNLVVPICHVPQAPGGPDHDGQHPSSQHSNCCDDCTLCAPAMLPPLPACPHPGAAAWISPAPAPLLFTPRSERVHSPRQAQAPPLKRLGSAS